MEYYLAVDLGGTNTNLAILTGKDNSFSIISQKNVASNKIKNFTAILTEFLQENECKPVGAAICAAGPIKNNICQLTNLPFSLNQKELSAALNIPVLLLNDFTAICFGAEMMQKGSQCLPLNNAPIQDDAGPGVVIGPGTGLGTGYFFNHNGRISAHAAEGGHSHLPVWTKLTADIALFMQEYCEISGERAAGAESIISGRGLGRLFRFFESSLKTKDPVFTSIAKNKDSDLPPLISKHANQSADCLRVINCFVEYLARFAQASCLQLLPSRGLYLAGGVSNKLYAFFQKNDLFMHNFTKNYKSNIESVLKEIPVYVITDYNVSLYGAAKAAWQSLHT